ncbi:MAG: aminoglycoside phosphotransferase family protein [Rikenellaceae bacterium]
MSSKLENIALQFEIEGTLKSVDPLGQGFINDTYIVSVDNPSKRYILQRKNKNIFTNVPFMMDNIVKVSNHLKTKIVNEGGDPTRESMTIIPTHEGQFYYLDEDEEYWAVCLFIEDTKAYDVADTTELVFKCGKGIGKFQSMLSDFEGELVDILPGFHNISYRYKQWDEAISNDVAGRVSELSKEIEWIDSRKEEMLEFWAKVESGEIPRRVSHNDTKISNILFDKDSNVLCVIDLDTVLSSTCLNDFGDAIRTCTNTGKEDDLDLDKVSVNIEMFEAYTKGYLSEASKFLNETEKELLVFGARYIIYEQALRFLMDYINGDTYYKIKSPKHNLERTLAQCKLLESLEEQYEETCKIVKNILNENC